MWATPTTPAGGLKSRGHDRKGEMLLGGQIQQWATPNARDWKNEDETIHEGHSPTLSRQVAMIAKAGLTGSSAVVLHPEFHEALQGFPRGWNDCERPATASYLSWRREHSSRLRDIFYKPEQEPMSPKNEMVGVSETLGPEQAEDFLPDAIADQEIAEATWKPLPSVNLSINKEIKTIVAVDTETDLIAQGNLPPKLICATIAVRTSEGRLVTDIRGNGDPDLEEFLTELIEDPSIGLVFHNAPFDLAVIARAFPRLLPKIFEALNGSRITDTLIREKLLRISGHGHLDFEYLPDGTTRNSRYSLADLETKYLSIDRSAEKTGGDVWRLNFKQLDGLSFQDYPVEASTYAMKDAAGTYQVWEAQQRACENYETPGPRSTRTEEFQTAVAFALFLTTCSGMYVDPTMVRKVADKIQEELSPDNLRLLIDTGILKPAEPPRPHKRSKPSADGTIKMTAGKEASISLNVLKAYIEDVCSRHNIKIRRTDPTEKKPEGQTSTESDFLEELRELDPVIEQYCHRQEQQKVVQALRTIGDATLVHPNFNVLVESGRTSSYGNSRNREPLYPSIQGQNADPRVRPIFVAPPGWVIVSCDYSALELVSLAQKVYSLFGRSTLRDQLLAGVDPHAKLGSRIAYEVDGDFAANCHKAGAMDDAAIYAQFMALKSGGEDSKATWKHYRKLAKPVGLGYPGGLGAKTLCAVARKVYELNISEDLAKRFKELWIEEYPEMPDYFAWITRDCIDQRDPEKFAYVSPLGMYRAGCTYCSATNGAALQTPSAEGAKFAHFNVVRAMFDESLQHPLLGCRPMDFVHDEILSLMPYDEWLTERALSVSKIMVESLSLVMPDLAPAIKAEPAAMFRWDKRAEPVWDENRRLQVWTPKEGY